MNLLMKYKVKRYILSYAFLISVLVSSIANAQEYEYKYERPLSGVNNTWHTIDIPTELYRKLNIDFSDVRILGIKANGDTIEAPYILKERSYRVDNEPVEFNLINEVKNSKGYYYTFELPTSKVVNSIELSFNKSNFNWRVSLEGSNNQQEWFTILKKNRIVGIENSNTSYKYTLLEFNNVSYKYFRIKIPAKLNPKFARAVMQEKKVTKGTYNSPIIQSFSVVENDKYNKTEVLISLKDKMPISYLNLLVTDSIDYYRSITVDYATDSIENKTGWHYIYRSLFTSTLSSLNINGYNFSNVPLKHIRITIANNDNEPLNYKEVKLHGNTHQLMARFTKPASYFLVYGNKHAYVPNYDITRFEENIPAVTTQLSIGKEVEILEQKEDEAEPLFKDDIWLWSIMIFVIFILGWFSIKMLKND